MKVLIISSNSPYYEYTGPTLGGAEASLRILAERLSDRGHEVHFVTQGRLIGSKKINHLGVEIHFIPPYRVPLLGMMSQYIGKLNKKMYSINLAKAIEKIVKEKKIEIIHSYVTFPDTYTGAMMGKKYNIPILQRIAGKKTITDYIRSKGPDDKIGWTMRNVDLFIPISVYLKEEMDLMLGSKNVARKCTILDIGMKVPDAKPPFTREKIDEKYILTSVSSFKGYSKRQDIIIDAVELLSKRRKDFMVQFIGDGENLKQFKNSVKMKGLGDIVIFKGKCNRPDVIESLKRSHVFVHASESEGLGKAVIEAMAHGLPVLASNVRAINDYITDGENGFLAENDPGSFAKKMNFVLDNIPIAEKVSIQAHLYALEHFQSKKNIGRYEGIFQSLLKN